MNFNTNYECGKKKGFIKAIGIKSWMNALVPTSAPTNDGGGGLLELLDQS
jgi:hypothetical protein